MGPVARQFAACRGRRRCAGVLCAGLQWTSSMPLAESMPAKQVLVSRSGEELRQLRRRRQKVCTEGISAI